MNVCIYCMYCKYVNIKSILRSEEQDDADWAECDGSRDEGNQRRQGLHLHQGVLRGPDGGHLQGRRRGDCQNLRRRVIAGRGFRDFTL